jgi:hypothetical protein
MIEGSLSGSLPLNNGSGSGRPKNIRIHNIVPAVLTGCFCSGLEFYCKLDENVSRLLSRVNGVVKVQEEERQQLTQSTTKKAAEARYLVLDPILTFNATNFCRKAAEA